MLWNSSISCLLVIAKAFKESRRCKPSHMSILLDCNSCVTGHVIPSTHLVSTKQAANWKVENNVKQYEALTNVSLLHLLSLLNFIFFWVIDYGNEKLFKCIHAIYSFSSESWKDILQLFLFASNANNFMHSRNTSCLGSEKLKKYDNYFICSITFEALSIFGGYRYLDLDYERSNECK